MINRLDNQLDIHGNESFPETASLSKLVGCYQQRVAIFGHAQQHNISIVFVYKGAIIFFFKAGVKVEQVKSCWHQMTCNEHLKVEHQMTCNEFPSQCSKHFDGLQLVIIAISVIYYLPQTHLSHKTSAEQAD